MARGASLRIKEFIPCLLKSLLMGLDQAQQFVQLQCRKPRAVCQRNRLEPEFCQQSLTLHMNMTGRRAVTADTAARLAKYFGGDAASWLVMQANYDLKTLPSLPEIERQVAVREQVTA
jgi:hypothetical protein